MRTKKGAYDTAYNVQIGCTENQIITYSEVVIQGNDKRQLIPAVKGILKNTSGTIKNVLADADYGNYDSFEYLEKENITGYIPYRDMQKKVADKPFDSSHFKYDADKDEYICPNDRTLTFIKQRTSKERIYRIYNTNDCKTCPFKDQCITAKGQTKRTINREVREPLREKMKERLQSEEGKKMYVRRMHPVEAIFGNLKYNLAYTHFLLRGLDKVKAEFNLMCLTYNLRKLLIHLGGIFYLCSLRTLIKEEKMKMPDMSINFLRVSTKFLYIEVFFNIW